MVVNINHGVPIISQQPSHIKTIIWAISHTLKSGGLFDTMYLPQEIIATKRDGNRLSKNQIQHFVDGVVQGNFFDYQATALLMALFRWHGC